MNVIRRIYAYLLALAGLGLLSVATANLAQLLIDVVLQARIVATSGYVRDTVSLYGAAAIVGLPVWLLHWRWIERTARRQPTERRNVLRHLYMLVVLAGAAIVLATATNTILTHVFQAVVGVVVDGLDTVVRPLPFAAIAGLVWLAHWRVAVNDRRAIGESGAAATLRRWYLYGGAFVALVVLLNGVQTVIESIWRLLLGPTAGLQTAGLAGPAATSLVAVAFWVSQWRILPSRLANETRTADTPWHDAGDTSSVLRAVYLFGALALGIINCLLALSQLLYYALARLLGVPDPGGASGNLVEQAAGPTSAALVYAIAWAYHRHALRDQAEAEPEAPRLAGIRRLYTYLVALLSLAVWASGLIGLLWALGDATFGSGLTDERSIRDRLALFSTLIVVGLPVWLLHWRAARALPEAQSLARRLYVYLSLIAAALTLVGSTGAVLYRLLRLVLGEPWSDRILVDLEQALSVAVVAAVVGAYHWRVLRNDISAAAAAPGPSGTDTVDHLTTIVEIRAADAASLDRAVADLRASGLQVTVRRSPGDLR